MVGHIKNETNRAVEERLSDRSEWGVLGQNNNGVFSQCLGNGSHWWSVRSILRSLRIYKPNNDHFRALIWNQDNHYPTPFVRRSIFKLHLRESLCFSFLALEIPTRSWLSRNDAKECNVSFWKSVLDGWQGCSRGKAKAFGLVISPHSRCLPPLLKFVRASYMKCMLSLGSYVNYISACSILYSERLWLRICEPDGCHSASVSKCIVMNFESNSDRRPVETGREAHLIS